MITAAEQTTRMVRFLTTGRPQLWPGDTPNDGTMRLRAAAEEALRFSNYRRKGTPNDQQVRTHASQQGPPR